MLEMPVRVQTEDQSRKAALKPMQQGCWAGGHDTGALTN